MFTDIPFMDMHKISIYREYSFNTLESFGIFSGHSNIPRYLEQYLSNNNEE